jgi:hypothetical protein
VTYLEKETNLPGSFSSHSRQSSKVSVSNTSTAYHPQTDGQSERTNQTIEIALRYLLTENPDNPWHEALPFLQHTYMNTIIFTGYSSNQVLYGSNTNWKLFMFGDSHKMSGKESDLSHIRNIIRSDVVNVIDFANARFKIIFDSKHKPLAFNTGDKVYLRLHHGYSLSEKGNPKLSNQRGRSILNQAKSRQCRV